MVVTHELSVIIPVFNEEKRVGSTLRAVLAYLRRRRLRAEVLVVDDGSTDATLRVVDSFRRNASGRRLLRVLKHPQNRGKGAAVRTGALASKGDRVLYMDADHSTPISEVEALEKALRDGAEVAVGSRALDRSRVRVHQPFYRELMGRVFNLMVQILTVPGLWDTQCGFKLFTRKAARVLFPLQTIERFGFDVELLYLARKKGFRVREVSVEWADSPQSRVSVFRDPLSMFLDLLVVRYNDLVGKYRGLKDL